MATPKEDAAAAATVPPPVEYKMRSERRAARVAQEKIAESAKYLASNKIMATTSPPPPAKKRNRKGPDKKAAVTTTWTSVTTAPRTTAAISAVPVAPKIAMVTVPPQIRMPSTTTTTTNVGAFKTAPIILRANAAAQSLPISIRPQLLSGHSLPRMPILVFNSLGSSIPTLIPISASPMKPNTIVTLAPGGVSSSRSSSIGSSSGIRRATTTTTSVVKTVQPVTVKASVVPSKPATTLSNVIANKFLRYNNNTKQTIGLTMECEEETLSSAQWLKYRKAESNYMDVLRKLARWKGRSDVEIVNLGPDEPIPPLPRFFNVQEASRLPIPEHPPPPPPLPRDEQIADCDVIIDDDDDFVIEMDTMSGSHTDILTPVVQLEDPNEKSTSKPRVNVIMISPSQNQQQPKAQTAATSLSANTCSSSSAWAAAPPLSSTASVRRPFFVGTSIFRGRPLAPAPPAAATAKKDVASAGQLTDSQKESLSAELLFKMNTQKLVSTSTLVAKQEKLDAFLSELMQTSTVSIDRWMVEKGLFGTTRICLFHPRTQMKLVFVSKDSKSGGESESTYKWYCSECSVMLPVNQGSFFSKWDHTHGTILRVIYHWACNTDVSRVLRDVGVDKEFVHNLYTAIRSVCAKQSVRWRIGGAGHVVEVAKMTLGSCKDVMDVSLFCAYDKRTKYVKLGASTPTFLKMKMAALYRVMVDKNSYVMGDQSLAPYFPAHFKDNFSFNSSHAVNSNAIMYLKVHALPTVKNLRSELKLESIQRILNELAWRERFGRSPLEAYNNILTHIKQSFISSVITTRNAKSVSITPSSGFKVVDTSKVEYLGSSLTATSLTPISSGRFAKAKESASSSAATAVATAPAATAPPAAAGTAQRLDDRFPKDLKVPWTIKVDCHMSDVIDINEKGVTVEAAPSTGPKRSSAASAEESKNSSPKAKRLKSSSDASSTEYIRVSDWMPPMGVQLESYYYGTKEGHLVPTATTTASPAPDAKAEPVDLADGGRPVKYKFKCHACKKSLDDNTKAMKHLNGHINALKQFNLDLSDLTNCKYCFREFESPYAMQTHVEEVHVGEQSKSPVCRICDKEFVDVATLCDHMKTSHVQCELPYKCLVCKYRTSFYRDIIAHFSEVHAGSDKLLCIHCLRVFTVKSGPGIQEGHTYGFYRHVYKHQSKSVNRRCPTCCLSFLSGIELQQHRNNDHCSFAKQIGVKPAAPSNKSKAAIHIQPSTKYEQHRENGDKTQPKLLCMECKLSIHTAEHYANSMTCPSCSYVTSCFHAFNTHIGTVHCAGPSQVRSKSASFPAVSSEFNCGCSYASKNGDDMAKHLSRCGRNWCYLTEGDTDSDSGGAKASLHESEDEVAAADDDAESVESGLITSNDDQHNMMNVLGLMRVSPRRRQRSKSTTASENSA